MLNQIMAFISSLGMTFAFLCLSLLMTPLWLARRVPSLTLSLRSFHPTSSFVILGLQCSYWALRFTEIVPIIILTISQSQFITNLLQEHGLQDCKPVSTPLNPRCCLSTSMCPQFKAEALEMHQYPYISIVGLLMYLALTTRPDIAFTAGVLARFNSNPGLPHW